jgi:dTDP-4-dehydrorhamnose reductase
MADADDLYGRSKFLGETDGIEGDAVTLRSSIIGRELGVSTHGLVEWLLSQRGKPIEGYARAIYSGVTTLEMARAVALCIDRPNALRGVYQLASKPISKFDLLTRIVAVGRLDVEIRRDETFVCDRSLVMDRFSADTGYRAPPWEHMIGEMMADPTPYDRYQGRGHV